MADITKIALFAGGILCGTAGLKLLKSKEAKKIYAHTTAAALRAKECVMTDVTKVREGCGDIMAEAKEINEKKSASDVVEVIEDERE